MSRLVAPLSGRCADGLALAALIAGILFSARDLLLEPVRAGQDATIFFWPTFAFLGERLRAGDIPGWNPHQFGGIPFAADPESGWMYAPAMLVFTLFPLGAAIRLYMALHLLLAGIGAFALGRALGFNATGALTAGWAFALSGLLSDRSRCCYAHVQVATWIPWALLGVEIAFRANGHRARLGGWLLTGVAISQMLGGWLGQGAYYGLLVVASFVVYRAIVPLPRGWQAAIARIDKLALHGLVPFLIGLGIAAPGVLPRLAYESRSNLAGGYTGLASGAATLGGWSPGSQFESLLSPSGWYIGAAVFALAIVAVVACWRRFSVPYFGTLTATTFILGLDASTPLHRLFALLPRFQETHDHLPERIALALAIGPAMLAGAAVSGLRRASPQRLSSAPALVLVVFGLATISGLDLPRHAWIVLLVTAAVIVMWPDFDHMTSTRRDGGRLVPIGLAVIVAFDLVMATGASLRAGDFARVELASITEPNATARQIAGGEATPPPRFFGFDPSLAFELHGERTLYRHLYQNPLTARLLVNNQATLWGLADAQGYNPLQLARYAELMNALNGAPQEYHGAYVLPSGLDSPLLPLLGSEYIVVPRHISPDQPALQQLAQTLPEVWGDDEVRILGNDVTLPRAWIVHDAVTAPRPERLALMSSGAIDFRRTVVLDQPAPVLTAPADISADRAVITAYAPDRLTIETSTGSTGMLVLSEVYDEGWEATVDDEPATVHVANHAFRGVTIPAGTHTIRLSYTPPGLLPGLAILAATGVLLTFALVLAVWRDGARFREHANALARE
ncbi:MAG: YfhO family protein [Chloroflexia bacterium]|nr:YfhO family protein [Chloroflexia bacterium]